MTKLRTLRGDLAACALLLSLALLWFAPVLATPITGKTLLPYDNLYTFEPFRSLHPGIVPHNNLLSDLVLENAVWKLHILRTWDEGEVAPLWNPQIFTGVPFLAAGQASTFYPLSILFYLLPLDLAYGWFAALQVALAGINLYIFARVLGLRRLAALTSGVIFMCSGFLIVSVVFTMFLAAVVWLPLLLAIIEVIIRKQEEKGRASFNPTPYVAIGVAVLALVMLAGHPELIYYTLLVAGAYSAFRLLLAWRRIKQTPKNLASSTQRVPARSAQPILKLGVWLLALVVLGVAAGGVQLLPLLELLPLNFRQGSVALTQVLEWAWPTRHVLSFFLPNVFGNPSHHAWFDIWSWQWTAVTANAHAQPIDNTFWGIKNYVEGGNYLGIATWLLAAVALLRMFSSRLSTYGWFFITLAVVSLLFTFGTPLYAVLFYGLPGWNQLHSPFRWVFPFTLSMAVLAGMGMEFLLAGGRESRESRAPSRKEIGALIPLLSAGTALGGLFILLSVVASIYYPLHFIALGQRIFQSSDLIQNAFADGSMFWSYQAANLTQLGICALLSGLLLWQIIRQGNGESGRQSKFAPLFLLIIAFDLYTAHGQFNPASPATLNPLRPENIPPVVKFINEREPSPCHVRRSVGVPAPCHPNWRFTTFTTGEQTFWANVGMYYGWQDIRGYDSIIPRQYAQLQEQILPQHDHGLLYNRIAPLRSDLSAAVYGNPYAVLDNPLLDLLNVKYVLTEHYIPNPTWREIYHDPAIAVYENQETIGRAFIVPQAQVDPAALTNLASLDARQTVVIEETPSDPQSLTAASPQLKEAQISHYSANEVFVDVNLSDRGWLVLTDAWFPGWKAYLRPFGAGENEETEIPIYRANGAFRTVYLPNDGQWTVRFVYSPMSFKLGIYLSFVALMTTLLLAGYWAWGRYYRPDQAIDEVRTVAKNTLVPTILSLTNKVLDFAYAMLYIRLLGKEGTGSWYFVVAIYGVFEIVSRYGLGTLLTRDVAEDKNRSSRYLTNVIALRTLLWLISLPVLAVVIWFYAVVGNSDFKLTLFGITLLEAKEGMGRQEIEALIILALSMLISNWNDALSSTFSAFEKMEYPAGLASAINLIKLVLGPLALLLGFGFVGLAGVSLLVNLISLVWLYGLLRSTLFKPQWVWDWPLQRWMFGASGALMINHLLATIFWRVDVWILKPLAGASSIGIYSIGLKYLDGFNFIPSIFTMAVFPLMSRYARREDDGLLRTYILCLRLLVMVALPLAMTVTFLARPMVSAVGGSEFLDIPEKFALFGREFHYLGGSDLALRVIIWSVPIGFVNSVTQYVLISVNQQRYLTRAFLIGMTFNIIGNLLLIPRGGYVAAALTTIASELILLLPFYYSVRRNVGVVPWLSIFAAPTLAVALMAVATYLLIQVGANLWLGMLCGEVVYLLTLLLSGALHTEEMEVVWRALPIGRLRRLLPVG